MELMMQPTRTSCGQTCVAMIANKPWTSAVAVIGHQHSTRTREIVDALRLFGFIVEDHLTVIRGPLPWVGTYLLKLRYTSTRSHWVVLHNGTTYDPAHGIDYVLHPGWRYTSYLKIRR